ncbi:PD-(D/E)XK motif protein [Rhodococcus sp. OK302]|uniref:PD-(D/E)XK motif protein n=1 Tax=Rhodococcus sp. OK302 TaxID=1882769 RepID=UPI000B941F4D|nr:PD-(D/E)XK motif protein [Rhodococcus sp. OK302]OYD71389.1 putative PD-(D/E)XK family protein DUF4420 [Rhodococcus sp. OK302]
MSGTFRGILADHWNALEAVRPTSEERLRTSRLPVDTSTGQLLAAVDAHGARHILVPIENNQRVKRHLDGVNLRVDERALETSGIYSRYADISCLDHNLNAIFTDMCSDVILGVASNPKYALASTNKVLDRWRSLFASSNSLLRESQLTGLFAELWVLRELLRKSSSAVSKWTGPSGHRHDFTFGCNALEIKGSLATSGRRVRIHGLSQLDAPAEGNLYLRWIRLQSHPNGHSIGSLVEEILNLGDDAQSVAENLKILGYFLADADSYRNNRFQVTEDIWYHIDVNFPRLTERQLSDAGILTSAVDVSYSIDLPDPVIQGLPPSAVSTLLDSLMKEYNR